MFGEVLEYCIDFYNYGSVVLNNYVVKDVVLVNIIYVVGSVIVKMGMMGMILL